MTYQWITVTMMKLIQQHYSLLPAIISYINYLFDRIESFVLSTSRHLSNENVLDIAIDIATSNETNKSLNNGILFWNI